MNGANNRCQPAVEESVSVKKILSPFQSIEIKYHPSYGHLLVLDNDLQIAESDHAYGRAMVAPLTGLDSIKRVLIMGGGDGGVLKELLNVADSAGWALNEVSLVDIDREVIHYCKQHLPRLNAKAFNDQRVTVLIEDVFSYLKHQRGLDAVIYDLTMTPFQEGQSGAEFIAETLGDIAASLRPGGLLSMQCCGEGKIGPLLDDENQRLLEDIRNGVDHYFDQRLEHQVTVPSYHEQWTFLSARKR